LKLSENLCVALYYGSALPMAAIPKRMHIPVEDESKERGKGTGDNKLVHRIG